MNSELFFLLEQAIDKVIGDNCERNLWGGYIHNGLAKQMATAAAQVFDASMDGQDFAEKEWP